MKIFVFTIIRNEAKMLPYFLRHYATFADRIFIWDDLSSDGTQKIATACPLVTLAEWPGPSGIVDEQFKAFAETEYKKYRGQCDWCIWVDADEFVYHPDIRKLLERYLAEGVEVPLVDPYGMISYRFPDTEGQIYDQVKMGYRNPVYAKAVVFQPKMDMQWHHGKHLLAEGFTPKRSEKAEIKFLHYRHIDPEYVKFRNLNNWKRMPEANRKGGFGWTCNPEWHGESSYDWYINIRPDQLFNVFEQPTP